MYFTAVILLMGVLPVLSIGAEFLVHTGGEDIVFLTGKWFVFWAVGIRLLTAGLRGILGPAFTAETIFRVRDKGALIIVQELGFATLSIGLLGTLSVFDRAWVVPAAIAATPFYGLAGIKHLLKGERNRMETIAMVSDLFIAIVLVADLAALAISGRFSNWP